MKEKLIGVSILAVVLSGITAIAFARRRKVWKVVDRKWFCQEVWIPEEA